jgi:hypothetical protein
MHPPLIEAHSTFDKNVMISWNTFGSRHSGLLENLIFFPSPSSINPLRYQRFRLSVIHYQSLAYLFPSWCNQIQYDAGKLLRRPPSTNKTLPVTYAPALLARNSMVPAISSSFPILSSGILSLGKTPAPMIPAARSEGNTVEDKYRCICKVCDQEVYYFERKGSSDRQEKDWIPKQSQSTQGEALTSRSNSI